MKYKDTIVPVTPHSESIWCPHCGEEFGIESKVEYEREIQAQVSFSAGIKDMTELSDELLEIGRKAIEDALIERRDSCIFELSRANGLVVRDKDGGNSSMIRFGPETALRIGMRAIGQALRKEEEIGVKDG